MQNELDIVRDVSARLERGGFAYMLTCSMAMNYYAQPRMTRDIDLVVALTAADTEAIVRLFAPDYYVSPEAVCRSIAHESLFNLIHQESVIKVDCIIRKSTEYRRVEFDRRQRIEIEDFSTWIVSKEDLIISKLWWAKDSHSEQQLSDVKNLAATGVDTGYVSPLIGQDVNPDMPDAWDYLPEAARLEMIEVFRSDVETLADMLDRDLSHWLR